MNETTLAIQTLLNKFGLFPGDTVLAEINELVECATDVAYNDGYFEAERECDCSSDYDDVYEVQ